MCEAKTRSIGSDLAASRSIRARGYQGYRASGPPYGSARQGSRSGSAGRVLGATAGSVRTQTRAGGTGRTLVASRRRLRREGAESALPPSASARSAAAGASGPATSGQALPTTLCSTRPTSSSGGCATRPPDRAAPPRPRITLLPAAGLRILPRSGALLLGFRATAPAFPPRQPARRARLARGAAEALGGIVVLQPSRDLVEFLLLGGGALGLLSQ